MIAEESESVNDILKSIEACPKDFKCVAKEQLFHGYRFEFWDSLNNPDICYYHRVCKYNYWNIMKDGGAEFLCSSSSRKPLPRQIND